MIYKVTETKMSLVYDEKMASKQQTAFMEAIFLCLSEMLNDRRLVSSYRKPLKRVSQTASGTGTGCTFDCEHARKQPTSRLDLLCSILGL